VSASRLGTTEKRSSGRRSHGARLSSWPVATPSPDRKPTERFSAFDYRAASKGIAATGHD
jgi:hypothetical protein